MHVTFALELIADTLERWSDEQLMEYRPLARWLLATSQMARYWAKQTLLLALPLEVVLDFAAVQKDVLGQKYRAVVFGVIDAVADAIARDTYAESRGGQLWGLKIMLQGVKAFLKAKVGDGEMPRDVVCMTCGATAAKSADSCGVCGGGGNQLVLWWDL